MNVLVITNDSTVFRYEEASAEEMFGGRVTEVRNLKNRLSEKCNTLFSIISGKYGLIPGNEKIVKYSYVPDSLSEYSETEKRTGFAKAVSDATKDFDVTLIFIPKEMFRMIIKEQLHGTVIAATSLEFKEQFQRNGGRFYERKGARIGKQNAEDIVNFIFSSLS